MQRSFKARMEALERLESAARDWRWANETFYPLSTAGLASEIVRWFRSGQLTADDAGAVVVRPDMLDSALAAVAEGLNALPDWGDLFESNDEIAQARWVLDAGYLIYHVRIERWDVFPTGWKLRPFVPYPDPFWAASRAAQAVHTAAHVAERRGAGPLNTPDALLAWLGRAQPFVVSEALHDAIGDIEVSHAYAQCSGWFDDAQL